MPNHTLDRFFRLALVMLLAGCATPDVVVHINAAQPIPHSKETPRRAQVQVTDLRREANLERTTIGGLSMGRITLQPSLPEFVQALVAEKADTVLARRGASETQAVLCGIRVFEIATPATPLYWDINTRLELVLRVHGQDRGVTGYATERTYVWPSQAIIERVTAAALRQIGSDTERAFEELFALPR